MTLDSTVAAALAEYDELAPDSDEVLAEIRTKINAGTAPSVRRLAPALAAAAVIVIALAAIAVNLRIFSSDTSPVRPAAFGKGSTRPPFRFSTSTQPGELIPAARRQRAESFTVPLLDRTGSFTLAEHRNHVVVLTWSATWCGPCLAARAASLKSPTIHNGVTDLLTIDTKDDRAGALRYFRPETHSPTAFDAHGSSLTHLGNLPTTLPLTVLIDRNQLVAAVYTTAVSNAVLGAAIKHLAQ